MKNGKIFTIEKLLPEVIPEVRISRAWRMVSPMTIGMIARVRVSFTVTALSKVATPNPCIESHDEAHAVTEEVSFTAVPAKIPKASPHIVLKPIRTPNDGKTSAAKTLKKKITEMACAISLSSASTTGAAAATAEPPQIEEPTPTRIADFFGMERRR